MTILYEQLQLDFQDGSDLPVASKMRRKIYETRCNPHIFFSYVHEYRFLQFPSILMWKKLQHRWKYTVEIFVQIFFHKLI